MPDRIFRLRGTHVIYRSTLLVMFTISKLQIFTVVCGVLAGAVFALSAYSAGSGLLLMFLPVIPVAIIGLSFSPRYSFTASLVACLTSSLLVGAEYGLFYIILVALPLQHLMRRLLLWREGDKGERLWYPVLPVLAEISAMTAAMFMIFAILAGYSDHGDLKTLVANSFSGQLDSQMDNADLKFAQFMKQVAGEWSFLIFACMSWMWVMMLYAFTVLASIFLRMNNIALRESLAISPEGMPLWVPGIIAISVLLAAFGHGNDRFAGEVVFLIMLLPYLLSGIASVHRLTAAWRNRRLWLAVFYFSMMAIPWIPVFLIAKGLHTQIETLLKTHAKASED